MGEHIIKKVVALKHEGGMHFFSQDGGHFKYLGHSSEKIAGDALKQMEHLQKTTKKIIEESGLRRADNVDIFQFHAEDSFSSPEIFNRGVITKIIFDSKDKKQK